MTITTAIIITVVGLVLYYVAAIAYDLYLDHLSKANVDEAKETAIDISDEADGFQPIPVENGQQVDNDFNKFENLICLGISAQMANRLMNDAANGENTEELDNIMYTIQHNQFQ